MAWIAVETNFERSIEVESLRSRMRWNEDEASGFCVRFWQRVLEHAPSGVVLTLKPELYPQELVGNVVDFGRALAGEEAARVIGRSLGKKPELFGRILAEMVAVRLLTVLEDRLLVTGWFDMVGEYLRSTLWKRSPGKLAKARLEHGLAPAPECPGTKARAPRAPDLTRPDLFVPPAGGKKKTRARPGKAEQVAAEVLARARAERGGREPGVTDG